MPKRETRHDHFEVWVCATNWYCPEHDDFLSCYLDNCAKHEGSIQGDWRLRESRDGPQGHEAKRNGSEGEGGG